MTIFNNLYLWSEGAFEVRLRALCVENGIITDILPAIKESDYPAARIIDMQSAYLYPGFIDTHTHSFEGGLYSLGVDLSGSANISEVLARIAGSRGKGNTSDTLFAWQLDETKLAEKRLPTPAELDHVCPNRALILRRIDGHSCVLNSFAKALVPNLETKAGILRGKENDKAVHYFHGRLSEEAILEAYQAAAQIALQGGFTGLHTMIGDADYSIAHYALIRDNLSAFPINFTLYPQSFNLRAAMDAGASRIGGCILADGSIGSETAALSEPYLNSQSRGTLYQSDQFWQDFITKATENGLQVAIHVIGDRAIRQINDIYLKIPQTAKLRHQLIHCEITDDQLISDIARSGAAAVMQPNFDLLWGGENGFYTSKLGLSRSMIMNRFASLSRQGVKVCGGSDWYITELNAATSIRACLKHHNPGERLSHSQAVSIYTENAAWLSHEEQKRGTLEKGYRADFCLYSHPLDSETQKPELMAVACRGELRYDKR